MSEQEAPAFSIEKIYTKDVSLEVPNAPEIFLEQASPEVNIQLQIGVKKVADDIFDVTLTVTVTAKVGEKTVFLVEVGQGGIFRVRNIPEENMSPLLSIACPNILFPYARETVASLVTSAGFAPVVLQPVNFEALYAQRLQQEQEAAQAAAPSTVQ